ncbi:Uncharacterised protein [Burkholderia pseudomallei]|nr:Uncharacterised protein [Burkholderia pseudomallei]CAJ5051671.1 Uncharacterised protein [Burkholderia pseudomallei]
MKIAKRIKVRSDARGRCHRVMLDRIGKTNDTGYSDDVVLSVLKAKNGPWSKPMSADQLLASLGIAIDSRK